MATRRLSPLALSRPVTALLSFSFSVAVAALASISFALSINELV
jgi:hypothetical protein